jgi:thioredoxin reductase
MDYLVIGAGPAGLQLAYFLARAGRGYLVVEAGDRPGTFFRTFPRHRRLISSNKRYTGWEDPELNLRMDWNSLLCEDPALRFTNYSEAYFPPADEMVKYLGDFAAAHRLAIKYETRIVQVTRKDGTFRVIDQRGEVYEAKRLIVASGVSKPYIPPIPGIELVELYGTVSVNPRDFVNQRVLIIGKGNSGFETADNLIETAAVIHVAGPSSIRFAWQTHYVGHLRAVNNNLLDTYQLKSQNALLDGEVERIERRDGSYVVTFRFSRANEVKKELRYDRVIVCTGFRFDASIFGEECRPELVIRNRFPAQTSEWESTNVKDLYFAGTLMQVRDYKKSTAGFIHGFRYCVRALHYILEREYHGMSWPRRSFAAQPEAMSEAVIARVNRASALWQQFASLCDLIVISGDGIAHYYEEVPMSYVRDGFPAEQHITISLEYGPDHDRFDPFDISVARVAQDDPLQSHDARYLHPVVRFYRRGQMAAEHHVAENLENEWNGPMHREPLKAFLAEALGGTAGPAPVTARMAGEGDAAALVTRA